MGDPAEGDMSGDARVKILESIRTEMAYIDREGWDIIIMITLC